MGNIMNETQKNIEIVIVGGATKILTTERSIKLKATLFSCERSELENKKYPCGILILTRIA